MLAFVYRTIFNIYYDIYLFVYLIFFSHIRMCVLAVLQVRTCVCVFCFVIPSSILSIPCYVSSAAACINLSSYFCHYLFFSHTHVRLRTHADAQRRVCFYYYHFPSTYSTYNGLCCFYFLAESRFTYTHLRIFIRADTHMRMFPYIFPVIGERVLPHVDPVVFILSCVPIFLPVFREDMLISRAKFFFRSFSLSFAVWLCFLNSWPKSKIERRKIMSKQFRIFAAAIILFMWPHGILSKSIPARVCWHLGCT